MLQHANIDTANGTVKSDAHHRPDSPSFALVRILLHADSGFARRGPNGLVRGQRHGLSIRAREADRLIAEVKAELDLASAPSRRTDKPTPRFEGLRSMTPGSSMARAG